MFDYFKFDSFKLYIFFQPLPGKHTILAQLDRYSKEFIVARMALLHRFLNRIAKHPVLSCNQSVKVFLTAKPSVSCITEIISVHEMLYIMNVFLTEDMQIARSVSSARWTSKFNVDGLSGTRFEEKQSLSIVYVLFDALLREIVAINVFLLTKTTCGS